MGEEGVQELLARTMEVGVALKLIASKELARVIVDSSVQDKAIAYPTDRKPLASSSSRSMPEKGGTFASRLGSMPMAGSSSACARSSNVSALSSGGCNPKLAAR